MSPTQRALWTFLFYTLAGPFMAAIVVLFATVLLTLMGAMPAASAGPAGFAVQTFAIGSFAAAFAGAGLAALVTLRGTFGWLEAAIAGVAAFMIVVLSTGAVSSNVVTALAFLAACIAVLCRALLVRIGILPEA